MTAWITHFRGVTGVFVIVDSLLNDFNGPVG